MDERENVTKIPGNRSQRELRLQQGDLAEFSSAVVMWRAKIASGVSHETVLKPDYWTHFAKHLRKGNIIFCEAEDGAWCSEVIVVSEDAPQVSVKTLWFKNLDETAPDEAVTDTHEVRWRGPHGKWSVVNKATGLVIKDKMYPKEAAIAFMRENLRKAG